MATTISPNMNLTIPTVGVEQGPNWANDLNSSLTVVDQHNHTSGQGVAIPVSGLNINAVLSMNGNLVGNAYGMEFASQSSAPTAATALNTAFDVGGNLFFQDGNGNNVQLTNNGSVNATSSGISSGTATAAFAGSPTPVLLVQQSSGVGASVEMQSAILTNSGSISNTLTLAAPTLSGNITQTLPALPSVQSFMAIDASGNMSAPVAINQGITASNIANNTITATQIADSTITSTQIGTNAIARSNLPLVGQQKSGSGSAWTTTTTTPNIITNLMVSISTTGRPVFISIQPDGTSNVSWIVTYNTGFRFWLYRGINPIAVSQYTAYQYENVVLPFAFTFLDTTAPAGTNSYSIYGANTTGGSAVTTVQYVSLVAYEL